MTSGADHVSASSKHGVHQRSTLFTTDTKEKTQQSKNSSRFLPPSHEPPPSFILSRSNMAFLVTGANKGIGFQIAKALLAEATAPTVFLGSRSVERGTAARASLPEGVQVRLMFAAIAAIAALCWPGQHSVVCDAASAQAVDVLETHTTHQIYKCVSLPAAVRCDDALCCSEINRRIVALSYSWTSRTGRPSSLPYRP